MTSTSAQDVRAVFTRATSAARSAGLDTSTWHLVLGSPTYGRAFRLVSVDPNTGGQSTALGLWGDYLGATRREAALSLDAMRLAWISVADQVAS